MVIELPVQFEKSVLEKSFSNYPIMDWSLLQKACLYYSNLGYKQTEVPWIVPENYSKTTKPHNNQSFVQDKDSFKNQSHELVGSAEQGFIYLLLNKLISHGKFFSVSPCFRFDNYDETHFPWFIKLELFIYPENILNADILLSKTINDSLDFFKLHAKETPEVVNISQDFYDINLNNIELGSYGIRTIDSYSFIYGTGLALPRFSSANK